MPTGEETSSVSDTPKRCGLERIKTVGDEYMAVAGAPGPRADTAVAAAEMALGLHEALAPLRWPTGDVITVRIGIASGPAIAGVIGRGGSPTTCGGTRSTSRAASRRIASQGASS